MGSWLLLILGLGLHLILGLMASFDSWSRATFAPVCVGNEKTGSSVTLDLLSIFEAERRVADVQRGIFLRAAELGKSVRLTQIAVSGYRDTSRVISLHVCRTEVPSDFHKAGQHNYAADILASILYNKLSGFAPTTETERGEKA